MRTKIFTLAIAATTALLAGCSSQPDETVEVAAPSAAASFFGPSGLEAEQELESRAALDAAVAAAAQAAADAAAAEAQRVADEQAAQAAAQAAAEQAAQEAADEAAEAAAAEDFDDGYVSDGLESACAQGTASIEECYGPGADADGNGIADVNEEPVSSGATQYEWLCDPMSPGYQPEFC